MPQSMPSGLVERGGKSSLYVLTGRIALQVIAFFVTILLVRSLSVEEYGIYNLLLGTIGYLAIASSLGLAGIFQRFLPELNEQKRYGDLIRTVKWGLLLRFGLSVFLIVLCLLLFQSVARFFKLDEYFTYFSVFSIGIIFCLQERLLTIVLSSLFLHKYIFVSNIIYGSARAILLLTAFFLGYGLFGVVVVEVFSYFLAFVVLILIFYHMYIKSVDRTYEETKKREFRLRLARYGGFSFLNGVGSLILDVSTDFFVISHFLGASSVAVYAFAARITRLLVGWMPTGILANVIHPVFFSKYVKEHNDPRVINDMFQFLVKINLSILLPLCVGVIALGEEGIRFFFGGTYVTAYPLLVVTAAFALSAVFPSELVLKTIEKVEYTLYGKVFSVYNLVMDIILIQHFGVMGVAVATGTALLFHNVYLFLCARRFVGIEVPVVSCLRIVINSSLMGICLFLLRRFARTVPLLILCVVVGIGIYVTAMYVNRVFSGHEMKILKRAARFHDHRSYDEI